MSKTGQLIAVGIIFCGVGLYAIGLPYISGAVFLVSGIWFITSALY